MGKGKINGSDRLKRQSLPWNRQTVFPAHELGSEAVLKTPSVVRPEIFGPLECLWKTHTDFAYLGFSPSPDILFCSKVSLGGFDIRGLTKE